MMQPLDLDLCRRTPGYWYLGTPYSKYPDGLEVAWKAACRATAWLLARGVNAISPIAHSHPVAQFGQLNAMNADFWKWADAQILRGACGLIVCKLPSWEESTGLADEIKELQAPDKPVMYWDPPGEVWLGEEETSLSETVLEEALRITSGDRQRDYDHPWPNHQRIARLWNAHLENRKPGPLTPEDIAWMMILLKCARDIYTPKRDNLTDTCGYARCLEVMRAAQGQNGYQDLTTGGSHG